MGSNKRKRLSKADKKQLKARFNQALNILQTDPEEHEELEKIFDSGLTDKHDDEEPILPEEVLNLPDWEADQHIGNIIKFVKDVDGARKTFVYKVYCNGTGDPQFLAVDNRFVVDTAMQPSDLKTNGFENLMSNYSELRNLLSSFIYFTDDMQYDLLALGAVSSYFREVFNTFPYFDFTSGTFGSGKTTAMKCLIWSSYNGYIMLTPTLAVLFRSIEDTHAAVGIDELDNVFKQEAHADIVNLLDSGHSKGIPTFRMNMEATPPEVVPYDPFGLKAWTRIGQIPPSLSSRSITIKMLENRGFKTTRSDPLPETFKEIRGKLYNYRLRHCEDIRKLYIELQTTAPLTGRNRDVFLPPLTIAKLVDEQLYDRLLTYAVAEGEEKDLLKQDSRISTLVSILIENNLVGERRVIELRDALNKELKENGELEQDSKPWQSYQVRHWLENLGFQRSKKKTHNYMYFDINPTRLEQLRRVYFPELTSRQETLPIPPKTPNLPNPPNPNQPKPTPAKDLSQVRSPLKGEISPNTPQQIGDSRLDEISPYKPDLTQPEPRQESVSAERLDQVRKVRVFEEGADDTFSPGAGVDLSLLAKFEAYMEKEKSVGTTKAAKDLGIQEDVLALLTSKSGKVTWFEHGTLNWSPVKLPRGEKLIADCRKCGSKTTIHVPQDQLTAAPRCANCGEEYKFSKLKIHCRVPNCNVTYTDWFPVAVPMGNQRCALCKTVGFLEVLKEDGR